MLAISSILFLTFLTTVTLFLEKNFIFPRVWLGIIQYLSYGFFLVFTGSIIYIWISEYIRKKQTFQREDFIKNMFNALENNGHIKINRPDVKVWKNQMAQGWASRIVELEIDKQRYIVICSFDGLEIFETYKKEEYEKLLAGPTAEQSQFQVNSPLRQIEVLQKKLQEKDKKEQE